MYFRIIFLGVLLTATNTYGNQQIQIPEAGAFISDEELVDQIDKLRHNVSELWENFSALKSVLTETLNHLRVHQAELEETVHMLEHKHEDSGSSHGTYTDDHHHHHSGEQHGSDSHSHGDDDHHHHSGEQHSHGDDHSHDGDSPSHSGEQHSHGDDHYHRSYSHSYSSASHQHGDSHEKGDDIQQTQQEANPMIEPLVVATTAQHHSHQHPHPAISNSLQLINDSHFNRPHSHHQHHHSHNSRSGRNRTVVIPKFSEVGVYDFAVCNVQPNRAIPEDQQQDVMGRINLWQKKSGGPLNIHIRLQGFDVGGEHGHHHGDHQAVQQESANEISATAGHRHGFHIHTNGDLSNGCQSTGPHFNPKGVNHGSPNALVRHVGDLGNIECDDHGNTNIIFNDEIASMKGPYSIIGKSMVIHSGQDDFGLGGNDESLRTGNAGTRIACCIIEKVDKLPIRSYKFIKAATPYQNA